MGLDEGVERAPIPPDCCVGRQKSRPHTPKDPWEVQARTHKEGPPASHGERPPPWTWTSNLQNPEEMKCRLLKPPGLWYFGMAARAK